MTTLTYLDRLEAESIDIMREAVSESERPVMLSSIGKDSSVMLHLASGINPFTHGSAVHTDIWLIAIIQEMLLARTSERQGRVTDHDSTGSMEKKKQEGYF